MSVKELIAYFLRNICAKNYQNRFMCVRVIARQSSDICWGHREQNMPVKFKSSWHYNLY